jgi:2-hydroxy-6-oxonona-2,4-dienedioate hydrolase
MVARSAARRAVQARSSFAGRMIRVDGRTVYARYSAPAPRRATPPIVMVSGVALSGRYLVPAGAELARSFPVFIPDLPGFGRSKAPAEPLTVRRLGDDLGRWMQAADLTGAVLLGNSFGCQVAVEAALQHPDRVSCLVLQGPTVDPAARTLRRQLARLAADAPREPPSLGPLQLADWVRTGPRRIALAAREMLRHRIEERLPEVRCPTLVITGSRDPIAPPAWAAQAAALVPRGELRVVPGAAHSMTYSSPLELSRLTASFLGV